MRKIVDVVAIYHDYPDDFETRIQSKISEGYEIQGGMCVSVSPTGSRGYHVLMVKYADETPPAVEPTDMATKLYDMALCALVRTRDMAKFIIDNELVEQASKLGEHPEFKALEKEIEALYAKL